MYNFYKIALECVSEEELTKIHEASIYILEKRGVVVHHEEIREIARKNGAKVENEIVYFSKPLVENAVKKAPEYFELHSRNKDRKITIGRDLSHALGPIVGDDLDKAEVPAGIGLQSLDSNGFASLRLHTGQVGTAI
jgi:trimethylamine--corrinoid protein Co-methyltransferase